MSSGASDATAAAGTTGTTGATAGTATGTSGAASAAGSSSGQTYRLIANGSALTEHVGKKLELTGVIENDAAASSGSSASGAASGPALRVTSGKIVAASCTP
jgi:hypothetical protein